MDLDLFGRPIPESWGKPGRPPHIPTPESRAKAMLCVAEGWPQARIAGALSISEPSLRKHYFRELLPQAQARDAAAAAVKLALFESAVGGNVGAQKEWLRRLDHFELEELQRRLKNRQEPKVPALGKKDQRLKDAHQIGGRFAVPDPPRLMN